MKEPFLTTLIDERAASGHSRPYALFPRSQNIEEGFRSVSYIDIANAINRTGWWLDSHLPSPKGGEKQRSFAYLGQNDLRYLIFVAAAMKTGHRIIVPSPRNTTAAQIQFLKDANCDVLVVCASLTQVLKPLLAAVKDIHVLQAPTLQETLAEEQVSQYRFKGTLEQDIAQKPVVTLHTSGSSGNPKPVTWDNSWFLAATAKHQIPQDQGNYLTEAIFREQSLLLLLPCFHAGGLLTSALMPTWDVTLVLGHPDIPMSDAYVSQILEQGIATAMLTPPTFLEALSQDAIGLEALKKLNHIGYAGGPLRPDIIETLVPVVPHLVSLLGATEYGWFHCISGSNGNSDAVNFYSDIGYKFDEIADGQFELVILNDARTNHWHGIFNVFPHLIEYRTRDVFMAKPNAQGWWKYKGRIDDLIVLSNGEKINPIPMENIIASHPAVKAALMVGEYRFSALLLIELEDAHGAATETKRLEVLDSIWPKVQEANCIAPGFAKMTKSLILFAKPDKPFLRAGKGTVQRKLTIKSYMEELDSLAASQDDTLLLEGLDICTMASDSDIKPLIKQIIHQTLEIHDLSDSDDIFHFGMDSLKVNLVGRRLEAALKACGRLHLSSLVNNRLVYAFPSIEKMTNKLILLGSSDENGRGGDKDFIESRSQGLESLLNRYAEYQIPSAVSSTVRDIQGEKPWNVILTGTTGSLGSYLLAALNALPETQVGKIFCLNRSVDGCQRQIQVNDSRGIESNWAGGDRVQFLHTDLAEANLGLSEESLQTLLDKATVIIHAAWPVNFNLGLSSFEPHILGVRNLLDFSARSKHKAPFIFISSISTTFSWQDEHRDLRVPEGVLREFNAPEPSGYAESKFVSELLIEKIAASTQLTTAILRVGQIAGPVGGTGGSWNKQEWFPSLIASSKHLGVLPTTMGPMGDIDWIPVDILASVIIELVEGILHSDLASQHGNTTVYNLVNPKTSSWTNLLTAVQRATAIESTIPLPQWVDALEKSSFDKGGTVSEKNPAVKLIDFFRRLSNREFNVEGPNSTPRYNVSLLLENSAFASSMAAVSDDWMELWIKQWNF